VRGARHAFADAMLLSLRFSSLFATLPHSRMSASYARYTPLFIFAATPPRNERQRLARLTLFGFFRHAPRARLPADAAAPDSRYARHMRAAS